MTGRTTTSPWTTGKTGRMLERIYTLAQAMLRRYCGYVAQRT